MKKMIKDVISLNKNSSSAQIAAVVLIFFLLFQYNTPLIRMLKAH